MRAEDDGFPFSQPCLPNQLPSSVLSSYPLTLEKFSPHPFRYRAVPIYPDIIDPGSIDDVDRHSAKIVGDGVNHYDSPPPSSAIPAISTLSRVADGTMCGTAIRDDQSGDTMLEQIVEAVIQRSYDNSHGVLPSLGPRWHKETSLKTRGPGSGRSISVNPTSPQTPFEIPPPSSPKNAQQAEFSSEEAMSAADDLFPPDLINPFSPHNPLTAAFLPYPTQMPSPFSHDIYPSPTSTNILTPNPFEMKVERTDLHASFQALRQYGQGWNSCLGMALGEEVAGGSYVDMQNSGDIPGGGHWGQRSGKSNVAVPAGATPPYPFPFGTFSQVKLDQCFPPAFHSGLSTASYSPMNTILSLRELPEDDHYLAEYDLSNGRSSELRASMVSFGSGSRSSTGSWGKVEGLLTFTGEGDHAVTADQCDTHRNTAADSGYGVGAEGSIGMNLIKVKKASQPILFPSGPSASKSMKAKERVIGTAELKKSKKKHTRKAFIASNPITPDLNLPSTDPNSAYYIPEPTSPFSFTRLGLPVLPRIVGAVERKEDEPRPERHAGAEGGLDVEGDRDIGGGEDVGIDEKRNPKGKRRETNRVAAKRHREKNKEKLRNLEERNAWLDKALPAYQAMNVRLQEELRRLEKENESLKAKASIS